MTDSETDGEREFADRLDDLVDDGCGCVEVWQALTEIRTGEGG